MPKCSSTVWPEPIWKKWIILDFYEVSFQLMQILELLGTYLVQLNWDSQQGRDRMQYFFLIGPILFLYHEESLPSSNLNSRFHSVRPNLHSMKRQKDSE